MLMSLFIQALTLSRALMALLISRLILTRQDKWALCVVILAFATDIADGWAARRFKKESTLGKVLDPVVDKIFVLCTVHALFVRFQIGMGLFYALCIRDSFLGLGALVLWKKRGCILSPSWMGKLAMGLQMTSIAMVMALPFLPRAVGRGPFDQSFYRSTVAAFYDNYAVPTAVYSALLASLTSFYYYALDFILALWQRSRFPDHIVRLFTRIRLVVPPMIALLCLALYTPAITIHMTGLVGFLLLGADIHRFKDKKPTEKGLNLLADKVWVLCLIYIALHVVGSVLASGMGLVISLYYIVSAVGLWILWKKNMPLPVSSLGRLSLWLYATSVIAWFGQLIYGIKAVTSMTLFVCGLFISLLSLIPLGVAFLKADDKKKPTVNKKP